MRCSTGRRAAEQQAIDAAMAARAGGVPELLRARAQKAMHRLHSGNPVSGEGTDD